MKFLRELNSDDFLKRITRGHQDRSALARAEIHEAILAVIYFQRGERAAEISRPNRPVPAGIRPIRTAESEVVKRLPPRRIDAIPQIE